MNVLCREAFAFFRPEELASLAPLGSGRVNDTWLAVTVPGRRYVLQRLNLAVFPEPALVQANLLRVTEHLRASLPADSAFKTFEVIRSPAGLNSWADRSGACWRLLSHLDGAALESIENADQAQAVGAALGLFHQLLATLPDPPLADTLPGFHNSPLYLAEYESRLAAPCQPEAADCRDFIRQRREDFFLFEQARQRGEITEQTAHGDPKVGNFLFSHDKKQVVSLLDLDTVKQGLLLHDLGDCLRSCCNPRGEELENLDDIVFRQDFFAAVLEGYLSRAAVLLKPGDLRLLPESARLISLELGLRFYSDYLAGSRYFKTSSPEQNLFRARMQFALVRSLECQYTELTAIAAAAAKKRILQQKQMEEKMKKFLLLCCCSAALAACADSKPADSQPPKFIELQYNSTAEAGDLRIHFASVTNDSRCPEGAQCVWAGNAEIVLELSGDGNHAAVLNTNPQFQQSYRTSGHVVTLKELKPYPEAGQTIPMENYVAVLTVEKK